MMTHERKGHQHLTRKPSNEGSRKSNETVCLDQFVQIDTEQFHGYAKMISEVKVLSHLNDMMPLIRVLQLFSTNDWKLDFVTHPFPQTVKNLDLH
jgi:hypothetical protein